MPGFKAPQDGLTLPLGASAAGDFKLTSMLTHHSEDLGAPKNDAKSTPPVLYNGPIKLDDSIFATWFTEYVKPPAETYCSEKDSFQNIIAHRQAPGSLHCPLLYMGTVPGTKTVPTESSMNR